MKGQHRMTGGLVGLMLVLSAGPAWSAEMKLGYVNVGKVFEGYKRTQDSEQTLEQRSKQKQAELETQFNDLKKMRDGLELLNDKAREAKARDVEEKSDAFQRTKARSERDLLRERNQIGKEIVEEIQQAVVEYAKANHFSVVFNQAALVYGQDAYDLTDEVLAVVNERYAAKGVKKAPAR